jgi:hypothetical protein
MEHLPSPGQAERNQKRKLAYLPPLWPLLVVILAVIVFAVVVH